MLYQNENAPVQQFFSLAKKVSLVTGGSRGIGLAAATGLAEAGSDIAITYNTSSQETIDQLKAEFEGLGVNFKAYKCNVCDKNAIQKCVEEVLKDFGRLDVVVPNAGIACHVPAEDFTEEEYRNIMAVNLDGAFFTAQAAAQAFKKQKASGILQQGRIVFTASVSSLIVNLE